MRIRHLFAGGLSAALLTVLICGPARAQPAAKATGPARYVGTSFEAVFDEWVARRQPRTAILVIRRGGHTVFQKGHNADPAKPTFIASLTKTITAACIAT